MLEPHRGVAHPPSPFPAPSLWPWQATGSAKDESRSLVSPLAAIAVKLEQRPANKAPPPLPPPPRCQKLCISLKCPPGNLPIYSCYLHDKGCSAAFSAACLKKAGKLEQTGRRAGEVRAPSPSPPPPAEPPRVPRPAEEGGREAGRLSPARGFAFQFCSH